MLEHGRGIEYEGGIIEFTMLKQLKVDDELRANGI
eukprot:CAMPEP_0201671228 /NCGR_PEP_ID=MMETSP0494-20130426/28957_1 /ASSEMBLY_ACC=CAM_ASM_000839 /TAXON_ID=420259 /ORGANISM="Thalassiosira gravida, Strain GMp14c1" /LENGTH=34 /DNA_ID= /DNA_START= /DNA_END= /DNA_ORIENTATION=